MRLPSRLRARVEGPLVSTHWLGETMVFAEQRSVIPRSLARTCLFSSMPPNSKRKTYTAETLLAVWGDEEAPAALIYQRAGKQLTQTEESIWLEFVRQALNQPLVPGVKKTPVRFHANAVLRALGRSVERKTRKDLLEQIEMIGDVRIKVVSADGHSYTGNLLDFEADAEGNYVVYLDMAFVNLFAPGWTIINLDQRQALRDYPLAQWLHTHYSTHLCPTPIGEDKLQVLCGREGMRRKAWLIALELALQQLQAVTGWSCKLRDGVVRVTRSARKATKEDSTLLDAWLATLTREQVLQQLTYLGCEMTVAYAVTIIDLRAILKSLLEGKPAFMEERLTLLQVAAEDI